MQVQGLMEIFGREWCNIFLWTVNGSALFHVKRDRAYWAACFDVLSEFWWAHLVPAKHALASGNRALAEQYRRVGTAIFRGIFCHGCQQVHDLSGSVSVCWAQAAGVTSAHSAADKVEQGHGSICKGCAIPTRAVDAGGFERSNLLL